MRRVLIAAVAALIAFLYAGAARGLVVQWLTSPDASYGVILAGVSAALVWKRRRFLTPDVDYPLATAAALLTLAAGCVMLLAGLVAADLFVTRASFVVVSGALIWFLAGHRALRAMAAPLLFLLLAIPLPELVVPRACDVVGDHCPGSASSRVVSRVIRKARPYRASVQRAGEGAGK